MKVSEFVGKLDSHGIYDADMLALDFKAETGHEPCWPVTNAADMARAVEARGLGGRVNMNVRNQVSGHEVAYACATQFAPNYRKTKMGRGSAHWEAVEALKAAGH